MDFYYGMFCGACFFVCLFLAVKIGRKIEQKQKEDVRAMIGALPVPAFEEDNAKRAARQRQAFEDMMSYNVTQALKGGKPNESND